MNHIDKATEYIVEFFNQQIDPIYVYHNLEHTLSVLSSVEKITNKAADLSSDDLLIVQLAALFHDTGYNNGPENHEGRSAQIAESYLKENGFDQDFIDKVKACIYATRMNSKDTDRLSLILQDADMSGLASDNFFDTTERLRQERNNILKEHISKNKWNETNIEFLKQCKYKTTEAQDLYKAKKNENLAALFKKYNKKQKAKAKDAAQTIATNKSAQTQFKTALRNHIDLSNIADNKANIMLSVNALILTLALPFLIDKSIDNSHFLLPTIVMSAVCLTSMIFATLATRPIKMDGYTSPEKIKNNESNLFFFGNYHKMSYEEYKAGVKYVLSKSKALDDSITRDLFYLGRSLGKKFGYLRWCYNIFMYGITVTVVALLIVYIT